MYRNARIYNFFIFVLLYLKLENSWLFFLNKASYIKIIRFKPVWNEFNDIRMYMQFFFYKKKT